MTSQLEQAIAGARDVSDENLTGDIITHPRSPWEHRHNAILRRYAFLRAGGPGTGLYVADAAAEWRVVKGEELDAAIDRAIEGER